MTEKKQRVRVRSYNKSRLTKCHAESVEILGEDIVINKRYDKECSGTKKVGPWVAEWCGTLFVVHGFTKDDVLSGMEEKIKRVRELRSLQKNLSMRKDK